MSTPGRVSAPRAMGTRLPPKVGVGHGVTVAGRCSGRAACGRRCAAGVLRDVSRGDVPSGEATLGPLRRALPREGKPVRFADPFPGYFPFPRSFPARFPAAGQRLIASAVSALRAAGRRHEWLPMPGWDVIRAGRAGRIRRTCYDLVGWLGDERRMRAVPCWRRSFAWFRGCGSHGRVTWWTGRLCRRSRPAG
jgi:hypothetical protein